MNRCVMILASIVLFTSVWGTGFAQTVVTECGQTVEGEGYLAGDLDCTGFEGGLFGAAILLGRGGRLDLRGFTITGGKDGVACYAPCRDNPDAGCSVPRCSIFDSVGGGVITRAEVYGVSAWGRVDVSDITISNQGESGTYGGRGAGVHADRIELHNVTISGTDIGVWADRRAKVVSSTITGNALDGISGHAGVYDSVVSNNGEHGVRGTSVLLRNVEVAGNGSDGVAAYEWRDRGGRIRVFDSLIVDNCATDTTACHDISGSFRKVGVRNTTYGTCGGCQ